MEEYNRGFLITCDKHKQKQAIKEAYNFLNQYIDDEYGDLEGQLIQKQLEKSGKQLNLENQIKAINKSKKNSMLSTLETNVNCLIFIKISKEFPQVDPNTIVSKLMHDVHKENKEVTRFCHKLLPVERAFKAEHFRMLDSVKEMFDKRGTQEIKSWALNFKCRNNSKFNYKQVLKEVEAIAKNYGHFADIYYPEWTVSIEIANHLMCLSIIEGYKEYQEYRLHKKVPNLKAMQGCQQKKQQEQASKNKKQRIQEKREKKAEYREVQEEDGHLEEKVEVKADEGPAQELLDEKIEVDEDDEIDIL